jgi:hypothetical protein
MLSLTRTLLAELQQPNRVERKRVPRPTSAARQRRARERARTGKCILRLEVDHDFVVTALLESEFLTDAEALDRRCIPGRGDGCTAPDIRDALRLSSTAPNSRARPASGPTKTMTCSPMASDRPHPRRRLALRDARTAVGTVDHRGRPCAWSRYTRHRPRRRTKQGQVFETIGAGPKTS